MEKFKITSGSRLGALLALAAIVVLLWLPSYYFGFGQEEFRYFHDYSGEEILKGFHSHWEPSLQESVGYRPGHALHIWLFYHLLGNTPETNHLIQLFLLLVFAWLFFHFLLITTDSASLAFWAVFIYLSLGNTAWHVAQIVNRQHLILLVSWAGMMLFFARYLEDGRRSRLVCSYLFFLLGLLVKETALTFPFMLPFLIVLIKLKGERKAIWRLWPFFLTLMIFLLVRYFATREAAGISQTPPPAPLSPTWMIKQYGKSLLGSLVPVQGTRTYEVVPREFEYFDWPLYFRLGISSLALLLFSGLQLSNKETRKIMLFGFIVYLLASVLVAAWYRTNRFFIADLGLAIALGSLTREIFRNPKHSWYRRLVSFAACCGLAGYLTTNLIAHQATLRILYPDDNWIVDHCAVEMVHYHEYIPPEMERLMVEKLRLYGDLPGTLRAQKKRSSQEQVAPEYPY